MWFQAVALLRYTLYGEFFASVHDNFTPQNMNTRRCGYLNTAICENLHHHSVLTEPAKIIVFYTTKISHYTCAGHSHPWAGFQVPSIPPPLTPSFRSPSLPPSFPPSPPSLPSLPFSLPPSLTPISPTRLSGREGGTHDSQRSHHRGGRAPVPEHVL